MEAILTISKKMDIKEKSLRTVVLS